MKSHWSSKLARRFFFCWVIAVMCKEMSQYKPKQIEETEMMPDQTNQGMVVACAATRARSALGAEMPKGTVCAMGGSLEGYQFRCTSYWK